MQYCVSDQHNSLVKDRGNAMSYLFICFTEEETNKQQQQQKNELSTSINFLLTTFVLLLFVLISFILSFSICYCHGLACLFFFFCYFFFSLSL